MSVEAIRNIVCFNSFLHFTDYNIYPMASTCPSSYLKKFPLPALGNRRKCNTEENLKCGLLFFVITKRTIHVPPHHLVKRTKTNFCLAQHVPIRAIHILSCNWNKAFELREHLKTILIRKNKQTKNDCQVWGLGLKIE